MIFKSNTDVRVAADDRLAEFLHDLVGNGDVFRSVRVRGDSFSNSDFVFSLSPKQLSSLASETEVAELEKKYFPFPV